MSTLGRFFQESYRELSQSNLINHAHQIVEQSFLQDFATLVSMGDNAEFEPKLLASRLNHFTMGSFHRTLHGAGKVGNRTCAIALSEENLVWVVN